jgi:hypothetical protein
MRAACSTTGREHLDEVVHGHVEEGINDHATVDELAECPLFELCAGGYLRVDLYVRLGMKNLSGVTRVAWMLRTREIR